jgi:hypothetical protein
MAASASIVQGAALPGSAQDRFHPLWRLTIFCLTLFFFSNVSVHGFLFAGWPIRPAAIFGIAIALLAPFIYSRSGLGVFATSIGYWCVAFVSLAVVWFIIYGADAMPSVLGRMYAALFLLFFFSIFSLHSDAINPARAALACGVIVAAACNVYEVLNPTAFLPDGFFYGRSAGFYVNPNQSGAAIVLGTVLGVGVVPRRWRWIFLAVALGGIALTLSRAAVLGWCVVVGAMVMTGVLLVRTTVAALGAVALTAYVAWQILSDYLLENRGINLDLLQERVGFFTTVSSIPDGSTIERAAVAEKAWSLFENSPFIGNGLGSTETWAERASTHNMYLYFMADYGVLGALLYPLLIFLVVKGGNAEARPYAVAFGLFAALWGLFSHNIVGELYSLLSFALIAAWVRTNASGSRQAPQRAFLEHESVH